MKLIGYVDGVELSFEFSPPDTFKAIIPKQLDGTYIVQLFAHDNAGNIDTFANTFVIINFDELSYEILESNINSKEQIEEFFAKEIEDKFEMKELVLYDFSEWRD